MGSECHTTPPPWITLLNVCFRNHVNQKNVCSDWVRLDWIGLDPISGVGVIVDCVPDSMVIAFDSQLGCPSYT